MKKTSISDIFLSISLSGLFVGLQSAISFMTFQLRKYKNTQLVQQKKEKAEKDKVPPACKPARH